jgi:ribosomal protein L11 methyltransferase
MNRADYIEKDLDQPPYSDLYVYYFKGHVAPDTDLRAEDFIGNWEEDAFSFLFFTKPSLGKVNRLLSTQRQLSLIDEYHMTYADWLGEKPAILQAGSFVITPPWKKHNATSGSGDKNQMIVLDPGIVFGTGTHPTTHDCLAAVEQAFSRSAPCKVLDLGTGTGLLALAAARLGSKKTLAVDNNFLAARTANKNIRLNRLEDRMMAVQGEAADLIDWPADLLIANIHFDVMQHLIAAEGFLKKKQFVLSGLLRSQARHVAGHLAQMPVKILHKWEHDGIWHTFLGETNRK